MIRVFGCSMSNWYWPSWPVWLQAHGKSVTNYAYKGYGNNLMYWQILDKIKEIKPEDHVIIMWPRNDRQMQWYDNEWIEQNKCRGFFPDTNGRLWFTKDTSYTGMYRWHPDHMVSLSHIIISGFACILQTQQLLNTIGCKYTMAFSQNPWFDGRPVYRPTFEMQWQNKSTLTVHEKTVADNILKLTPVKTLLEMIDWSVFTDPPANIYDPSQYPGIWEYYIGKKEYVIYKHNTDNHPIALAHHDWAVEKILKENPKKSPNRSLAEQISNDEMGMVIPEFTQDDYVAEPGIDLLDVKYKNLLGGMV